MQFSFEFVFVQLSVFATFDTSPVRQFVANLFVEGGDVTM